MDLASRIQQLEDRIAISECVINYAAGVDRADWKLFSSCFADEVDVDFSDAGMAPRTFSRDEFVDFTRGALGGFTARQHLSPNHVIDFDADDPDSAVCESYMVAQHYLQDAQGGDYFVMHGSYTNQMRRTPLGWRIRGLVQRVSWSEGNTDAPAQAGAPERSPKHILEGGDR